MNELNNSQIKLKKKILCRSRRGCSGKIHNSDKSKLLALTCLPHKQ
jgi:hypothetical protein